LRLKIDLSGHCSRIETLWRSSWPNWFFDWFSILSRYHILSFRVHCMSPAFHSKNHNYEESNETSKKTSPPSTKHVAPIYQPFFHLPLHRLMAPLLISNFRLNLIIQSMCIPSNDVGGKIEMVMVRYTYNYYFWLKRNFHPSSTISPKWLWCLRKASCIVLCPFTIVIHKWSIHSLCVFFMTMTWRLSQKIHGSV
jgi:hypothetical protein